MQQVLDAVRRVRAAAAVPQDSRLSVPLDPDEELQEFDGHLERMRESRPLDGRGRPELLDVDGVLARWRETPSLQGFTRREIRALCWDTRAAADEQFLAALRESDMIPARTSLMRGLWFAHQQGWRLPSAAQLEALFSAMSRLAGAKPAWVRNTASVGGLFDSQAPAVVSKAMVEALPETTKLLERLRLSADGNLARDAMYHARAEWMRLIRDTINWSGVSDLLQRGVEGLLTQAMIDGGEFRKITEELLLLLRRAGDQYKDAMRTWIVHEPRLGHPRRRRTSGNWVGMSEEARQAAVRLFAARDLRAFFDILIGNLQDYQHRREFWLRYVDSPQLVDFAVACDWEDKRKLRASRREGAVDVAQLHNAPVGHSAFIMRFKGRRDVVIAEMSQPKKAMYLFDTDLFEQEVGQLDEGAFNYDNLRSKTTAEARWVHGGGWHITFAANLNALGVRPG